MRMVTQKRLRELFRYDPQTGHFIRRIGRSGPRARVGDIAGTNNGQGYIRIYVDGVGYKAHRLAWLYVYGTLVDEIDHINLDRSDNRICNLREATRGQNRANCRAYRSNTSGLKGVSFYRPNGKWKAQVQKNGKKHFLGYYATKNEAAAAYSEAANSLFGAFARTG